MAHYNRTFVNLIEIVSMLDYSKFPCNLNYLIDLKKNRIQERWTEDKLCVFQYGFMCVNEKRLISRQDVKVLILTKYFCIKMHGLRKLQKQHYVSYFYTKKIDYKLTT